MPNYMKRIDNVDVEMTDEEHAARVAEEKEWAKGSEKRAAMAKLVSLEDEITPRRIRDAFASDEGKKWVADVEAEIAKERAKL